MYKRLEPGWLGASFGLRNCYVWIIKLYSLNNSLGFYCYYNIYSKIFT